MTHFSDAAICIIGLQADRATESATPAEIQARATKKKNGVDPKPASLLSVHKHVNDDTVIFNDFLVPVCPVAAVAK